MKFDLIRFIGNHDFNTFILSRKNEDDLISITVDYDGLIINGFYTTRLYFYDDDMHEVVIKEPRFKEIKERCEEWLIEKTCGFEHFNKEQK